MSLNKIIEGHYNNLIDKNRDLLEKRIKICRNCKLYTVDNIFGEVCNKYLFLNPVTNETSEVAKPGFKHGCGCILVAKARLVDEECPIKKW